MDMQHADMTHEDGHSLSRTGVRIPIGGDESRARKSALHRRPV